MTEQRRGKIIARGSDAFVAAFSRLMARTTDVDGCWVVGNTGTHGYGHPIPVDGKRIYPHRLAYEAVSGPIPEGLEIDHLCRNRACVNPAHLEPVTASENVLRSMPFRNRPLTYCTVEGCDKRVNARGLCHTHYWRFRQHGSALADRPIQPSYKGVQCANRCGRLARSRYLCHTCYERTRRQAMVAA